LSVVGDAAAVLEALGRELGHWQAPSSWTAQAMAAAADWNASCDSAMSPGAAGPAHAAGAADAAGVQNTPPLPSDAQVIGAVWRAAGAGAVVVGAAGGLPGELHKLWRTR